MVRPVGHGTAIVQGVAIRNVATLQARGETAPLPNGRGTDQPYPRAALYECIVMRAAVEFQDHALTLVVLM